jgi:hypothetical protein
LNSLYCFLGSQGLIFLKRGYLPFAALSQLTEPWLQPDSCYQAIAKGQVSAQEFNTHLQQQYDKLAPHLKQMLSFDYFLQQSQAKREAIESAILKNKQSSAGQDFSLARLESWRYLSLWQHWQNLSAWQHAGAQGKGLVLELDLAKSGFLSSSYNQQAQHFSQVQQVDHWLATDDLYYVFNQPRTYGAVTEEWRIVRQLQAADRSIEIQGQPRAMYRLPAKAVNKVIMGYRCSEQYCREVQQYLSQDINYRHIDCVQAQINPSSLCLQQGKIEAK